MRFRDELPFGTRIEAINYIPFMWDDLDENLYGSQIGGAQPGDKGMIVGACQGDSLPEGFDDDLSCCPSDDPNVNIQFDDSYEARCIPVDLIRKLNAIELLAETTQDE